MSNTKEAIEQLEKAKRDITRRLIVSPIASINAAINLLQEDVKEEPPIKSDSKLPCTDTTSIAQTLGDPCPCYRCRRQDTPPTKVEKLKELRERISLYPSTEKTEFKHFRELLTILIEDEES